MASHRDLLRELCRLCGNKRAVEAGRTPIAKDAYEKTIRQALSIQTKDEDDDIFPPFICILCERKLARFKSLQRKKKACTVNIILKEYKEHNGECEICKNGILPIDDIFEAGKKAAEEHGLSSSRQHDRMLFFSIVVQGKKISVPKSTTIYNDGTWDVTVVGKDLSSWASSIPKILNTKVIVELVSMVASAKICQGNADYVEYVRKHTFRNYTIDSHLSEETVRHIACKGLVVDGDRCSVCKTTRSDLNSMQNRKKESTPMKSRVSSHTRLNTLTKKQLIFRAKEIQKNRKNLKLKHNRLQEKVRTIFQKESVEMAHQKNADIETIVDNAAEEIQDNLKDNSPQKLLWEEQLKARKMKDRRSIRWHPSIIRWAIAIHSKSPASYKLIKDSGLLMLPAVGTLHKYTHYTDAKTGVHQDVIDQFVSGIKFSNDSQRNVSLLCDEMKIHSGVVYSASTGSLLGFVDVGSINNELRAFENKMESNNELASHAFMIMVRCIFLSHKQAVALFPTSSLRSGDLYDCILQTVSAVETAGLKVRAIVSDGATCNRKFYKLCMQSTGNFSVNPFDEERKIYFFCDVPHLLKTARNNLENAGFNRKSRNLQFGDKHIRWTHLVRLFEWDSGSDLRLLPKLSPEHLYLTPSLRMRVKLAAQVLSKSVSNAFRVMSQETGDTSTEGTREFVEMFDKFFDCLNVTTKSEGERKRNVNLLPYRDVNDERFEWLKDVFLKYISDWEESIASTPNLKAIERERRCISKETRDGLRITVNSFVALTKELLVEDGVEYVLSEKFSQDPIEEYFSKQRHAGGSGDNPGIDQVANNMLTFQVAGAAVVASKYGNVTKRLANDDIDQLPLPKKKKK
ncbi:uncharacterized protein LOC121424753 isoform X2 [Lytechinus variegatus]|nr:uncharacterized protein LOC121424753 isoform X2 [Lytechinus variegatus]